MMYTVLLVDDEQMIRDGMRLLIDWDKAGFAVSGEAESGTQAMELLSSLRYDVLLTDIRLPGASGLELIEYAKSNGSARRCIAMSAYKDFEYAYGAIKHGVKDFLLKPVNELELERILGQIKMELDTELSSAVKAPEKGLDNSPMADFQPLESYGSSYNPELLVNAVRICDKPVIRENLAILFQYLDTIRGNIPAQSVIVLSLAMTLAGDNSKPVMPDLVRQIYNCSSSQELKTMATGICNAASDTAEAEAKRLVPQVKAYVQSHFKEKINIKTISEELSYNPGYLGRAFSLGEKASLKDYLIRVRIEQACKLLADGDRKIADVARECGFSDNTKFFSAFKSVMGCTPKEYVKRNE